MRKTLLLAACASIAFNAFSQCIPNQLYADSVYGVWPDTVTNFRSGTVGVFYSDTLQVLVPTNAGLINPAFNGFNIDSVALVGITGLPPGIEVICHSQTADLPSITRQADVLIAAIGKPEFVTADMVKPGAVVIDVGMNRDDEGKLCGDVDFAGCKEVAGHITPVPGGVGPMTITMLLVNTMEAAERSAAQV